MLLANSNGNDIEIIKYKYIVTLSTLVSLEKPII